MKRVRLTKQNMCKYKRNRIFSTIIKNTKVSERIIDKFILNKIFRIQLFLNPKLI